MNHFLIITNESKDPELILTKKIKAYIENKGGFCSVLTRRPGVEQHMIESELPGDTECVLVLGGDGTLLRAARDTAGRNIPILGVNLGTLGFLAEVEKNHVETAIDRLFDNDYEIQERMMLCGSIIHENTATRILPALNDITITRCGSLQIIRLRIYVNHQYLCQMSADGMIAATPTGSTGYNMSAGGPIVEPGAAMIILTPICAHTLNARSIILKSEDEVEIEIDHGRDGSILTVEANSDGSEKILMKTGDRILIKRSLDVTKIVKLNEVSFVETLHKKMSDE